MAGSVNRVTLLGNVGRDPEIHSTQSGTKIANISIATSERWTDKNSGEKKERTEWHRVVVFNPNLVPVVEKYVKKGSRIYVEGSLQTRKWTAQDGTEKYSTEVVLQAFGGQLVLLGGGDKSDDEPSRQPARSAPAPAARPPQDDLDDQIPF